MFIQSEIIDIYNKYSKNKINYTLSHKLRPNSVVQLDCTKLLDLFLNIPDAKQSCIELFSKNIT